MKLEMLDIYRKLLLVDRAESSGLKETVKNNIKTIEKLKKDIVCGKYESFFTHENNKYEIVINENKITSKLFDYEKTKHYIYIFIKPSFMKRSEILFADLKNDQYVSLDHSNFFYNFLIASKNKETYIRFKNQNTKINIVYKFKDTLLTIKDFETGIRCDKSENNISIYLKNEKNAQYVIQEFDDDNFNLLFTNGYMDSIKRYNNKLSYHLDEKYFNKDICEKKTYFDSMTELNQYVLDHYKEEIETEELLSDTVAIKWISQEDINDILQYKEKIQQEFDVLKAVCDFERYFEYFFVNYNNVKCDKEHGYYIADSKPIEEDTQYPDIDIEGIFNLLTLIKKYNTTHKRKLKNT